MQYEIKIPESIAIKKSNNQLILSNGKATTLFETHDYLSVKLKSRVVCLALRQTLVKNKSYQAQLKPLLGTQAKIIASIVFGLSKCFTISIVLSGLGFKGELSEKKKSINLRLGHSHSTSFELTKEIEVSLAKENVVLLKCSSKEKVTNFAKTIQRRRYPDVYKNKGVIIRGEIPLKKKFKKR